MYEIHRKKLIFGLLCLNLVFVLLFAFAFINLVHQRPIVDIGLSASAINWIVIIFSLLSMINTLFEISKVD